MAWLAKFNPFVMVLISALLVFLGNGATEISRPLRYNLNDYASQMIEGIILFFILGSEFFINYRIIPRGKEGAPGMNNVIARRQSAVTFGTVILFGALGELITEGSGNLNLGTPGVMYLGGIARVWWGPSSVQPPPPPTPTRWWACWWPCSAP